MTLYLPDYVRSSDIDQNCMAAWALEKIHAGELPEASYHTVGSAVHAAIEAALADHSIGVTGMEAVAMDYILTSEWDRSEDGRGIITSSKRTEEGMLEDAYRLVKKWYVDVLALPISPYTNYDMDRVRTEVAMSATTPNGTPVYSTVDALLDPVGIDGVTLAIVDWKTGATAKAKPSQLWTYTWLAVKNGYAESARDVAAWFHFVDHSKVVFPAPYPGDEIVEAMLDATYVRQVTGPYATANPDWYCNYCKVREWCPYETGTPVELPAGVKWAADPALTYSK